MKPATYERVMRMRKRDKLWTEACFLEDRDDRASHRKAFRLLRESAALGSGDVRNNVANAYDGGRGVRPSRRMAMHWYRKAWRSGHYLGASNAAITLRQEGRTSSAIPWFYKAIEMGDPDARLHLAKIFASTPDNRQEACLLLRQYIAAGPQKIVWLSPGKPPEDAEDEGFEEAKQLLAQLESQGA